MKLSWPKNPAGHQRVNRALRRGRVVRIRSNPHRYVLTGIWARITPGGVGLAARLINLDCPIEIGAIAIELIEPTRQADLPLGDMVALEVAARLQQDP